MSKQSSSSHQGGLGQAEPVASAAPSEYYKVKKIIRGQDKEEVKKVIPQILQLREYHQTLFLAEIIVEENLTQSLTTLLEDERIMNVMNEREVENYGVKYRYCTGNVLINLAIRDNNTTILFMFLDAVNVDRQKRNYISLALSISIEDEKIEIIKRLVVDKCCSPEQIYRVLSNKRNITNVKVFNLLLHHGADRYFCKGEYRNYRYCKDIENLIQSWFVYHHLLLVTADPILEHLEKDDNFFQVFFDETLDENKRKEELMVDVRLVSIYQALLREKNQHIRNKNLSLLSRQKFSEKWLLFLSTYCETIFNLLKENLAGCSDLVSIITTF
jgi:hypothetical protein